MRCCYILWRADALRSFCKDPGFFKEDACEISSVTTGWVALTDLLLSLILLWAIVHLLRLRWRYKNATRQPHRRPRRALLLLLGLSAVVVAFLVDLALSRLGIWGDMGFRIVTVVSTLLLVVLYHKWSGGPQGS